MRTLFVTTFTLVAMAMIGLWLTWVRETQRWDLLTLYFVVLGFVVWKLWDYREPDS